ncbi:MarR family winged helix-turn-helix transcriptional regulator [Rhodococcus sp. NPDC003318]|uniref:MarR family winged helix-turn-helix transcriptional regulator n=1 Tax=Rhodococcus sp. NPDC003318 TaxID=3364503 RepID=UPI0036B1D899
MQHSAVELVHEELVHLVRQLMTGERTAAGAPSFAQHSVLSFIERHQGCRATEIADAFGVHRSTVSRQIRGCVESGWVRAEPGPVRTGHPLTLTDAGRQALAEAGRHRLAEVAQRVQGWTDVDVDQLGQLLRRFRTATSHPDSDDTGGVPNA